MKEEFEAQAASLGPAQESVSQLSFDGVIAEGLGDWLKKAKDGFSKAGTKLNNALTVDGAKGIGKAVADKAKGMKDKAKGALNGASWGRLAKVCLAVLAVGAVITTVIAALSGEGVPQEEEEAQEPKEFSSFEISYDKDGDGKISDSETETLSSMDEYRARVQQLISDRKSFVGSALEQSLGEDGGLVSKAETDSADFSEGDGEVRHSDAETRDEKIEYGDGTVVKNDAKMSNSEYELAKTLANRNGDGDFRSMSPEEKAHELERSGFGRKGGREVLQEVPWPRRQGRRELRGRQRQ